MRLRGKPMLCSSSINRQQPTNRNIINRQQPQHQQATTTIMPPSAAATTAIMPPQAASNIKQSAATNNGCPNQQSAIGRRQQRLSECRTIALRQHQNRPSTVIAMLGVALPQEEAAGLGAAVLMTTSYKHLLDNCWRNCNSHPGAWHISLVRGVVIVRRVELKLLSDVGLSRRVV